MIIMSCTDHFSAYITVKIKVEGQLDPSSLCHLSARFEGPGWINFWVLKCPVCLARVQNCSLGALVFSCVQWWWAYTGEGLRALLPCRRCSASVSYWITPEFESSMSFGICVTWSCFASRSEKLLDNPQGVYVSIPRHQSKWDVQSVCVQPLPSWLSVNQKAPRKEVAVGWGRAWGKLRNKADCLGLQAGLCHFSHFLTSTEKAVKSYKEITNDKSKERSLSLPLTSYESLT